jgi:transposase InsO family protein
VVPRAGLRPSRGRHDRQRDDLPPLTDLRALLARHQARHIRTPPYTPRWNGKVERFIQTLDREWAKSQIWPNHQTRDRSLSSFLRYYNRRRPHSSLGDRPPISRVHNLPGQDS